MDAFLYKMKNLLKVEKARHDLIQEDLAKKLGVSRQTIYAIEKNKFNPSVTLAIKMVRYFKPELDIRIEVKIQ